MLCSSPRCLQPGPAMAVWLVGAGQRLAGAFRPTLATAAGAWAVHESMHAISEPDSPASKAACPAGVTAQADMHAIKGPTAQREAVPLSKPCGEGQFTAMLHLIAAADHKCYRV